MPSPSTTSVLSVDECLSLLVGEHIGRLAFVVHGEPVVLPVTYALDGDVVTFRTGARGTLHVATWRQRVALEADGLNRATRSGWSVLVKGVARRVTDPAEVERLSALPLLPWGDERDSAFVQIDATAVTGRRIAAGDALAGLWLG